MKLAKALASQSDASRKFDNLAMAHVNPFYKENQMSKRILATVLCSALSLIGANGIALSETIARYECNVIGTTVLEPIGDRNGHNLGTLQYSCFSADGLLKGAVYAGTSIGEWDGPKGTYLYAGGIHRAPGGLAVTDVTEGTASVVMKDGKPFGSEASGKVVTKFASGTLATLSGKTFKFTSKPTGFNRFELELTSE